MIIRIRKRSQSEWVIAYILMVSILQNALIEFFQMPAMIKYTIDLAWCFLLVLMCIRKQSPLSKEVCVLMLIAGAFFLFTVFGFVLNYQSFLYYLWGLRNNIRFFVFFIGCIFVLKYEWSEGYLSLLDKLFWINAPVVLFQLLVLKKNQDFLGGIFGVEIGCNAFMNAFLLIVLTRSFLRYLHKHEKLGVLLLKCAIAFLIAAASELKMMIIEIILIAMLSSLMMRFTMRKLVLMLSIGIGVVASLYIISILFSDFAGWFNLETILEIVTATSGYTGSNDVNRLTAVPVMLERFLISGTDKVFGLGLGNCDNSTFEILKTPFYEAHKSLHYHWFSSAFVVLETGLLGLFLYLGFFVAVFFMANIREKQQKADKIHCQITKVMSIMAVITVFYNSALRTEAGYMVFFTLALPFIRKSTINCTTQTISKE